MIIAALNQVAGTSRCFQNPLRQLDGSRHSATLHFGDRQLTILGYIGLHRFGALGLYAKTSRQQAGQ
jgi:hypothetical protein